MHIFLFTVITFVLIVFFVIIFPKLKKSNNELTALQKDEKLFQDQFDEFIKNNQDIIENDIGVSHNIDIFASETLYYEIILKNPEYKYRDEDIMPKIETGSENFDKNIYLFSSNKRKVISKLSQKLRNRIIILSKHVLLRIEDNKIILSSTDMVKVLDRIIIEEAQNILKLLNIDEDIDQNLINNIKSDPLESVRIKNLKMLTASTKIHQYKSFFKELQNDENIEIAVIASTGLEEKGKPKLLELLKSADRNVILIVLKYINKMRFSSNLLTSLYDLLKINDEEIVLKALNILSSKNKLRTGKKIAEISIRNNPPFNYSKKIKYFLIQYFTKYKVTESCEWFIKLLNSSNDEYKKEIIYSLGEIGDIRAVEHLQKYTNSKNNALHLAALKSINKIQKNIPKEFQGDLMISENNESGELSLSDNNQDGKLTIEE